MYRYFSPSLGLLNSSTWMEKHSSKQIKTSSIIPDSRAANQSYEAFEATLSPDLAVIKSFLVKRDDAVHFSHVRFLNYYLPAAIRSRTKDLIPKLTNKQKQRLCLCYVISTHIKSFDKNCYARKTILIDEYNAAFPLFGLSRGIKKTTFDSVLKECYSLGLVTNVANGLRALTFHYRQLIINFDAFKVEYSCAYNLAKSNARKKVNTINVATYQRIMAVDNSAQTMNKSGIFKKITSKLGLGRPGSVNANLSIDNMKLADSGFSGIGYIREKRTSKEVKKILNRSTGNKFNFSCFNQDSKLAEELQTKARSKTATNKDLSDLLCLHIMHSVCISKPWHKFLRKLAYVNQLKSEFEERAGDIFLKAFPLAF